MNKYRFLKEEHIHQIQKDGEWKNLDGTSISLKITGGVPLFWAAGMSLKPFGWKPLNKDEEGNPIKGKALKERAIECSKHAYNTLTSFKNSTPEEYMALLKQGYHNHATFTKQKADEGTSAHEKMEEYIKGEISGNPVKEIHESIKGMVELSKTIVEKWLFSELYVYSEKLWIGGIIDNGFIHKDGRICLGDFKNRDKVRVKDIWQLGGYNLQLLENNGGFDADGNRVFELPSPVYSFFVFPLKKAESYIERNDTVDIMKDYESINRLYKRDRILGECL